MVRCLTGVCERSAMLTWRVGARCGILSILAPDLRLTDASEYIRNLAGVFQPITKVIYLSSHFVGSKRGSKRVQL